MNDDIKINPNNVINENRLLRAEIKILKKSLDLIKECLEEMTKFNKIQMERLKAVHAPEYFDGSHSEWLKNMGEESKPKTE